MSLSLLIEKLSVALEALECPECYEFINRGYLPPVEVICPHCDTHLRVCPECRESFRITAQRQAHCGSYPTVLFEEWGEVPFASLCDCCQRDLKRNPAFQAPHAGPESDGLALFDLPTPIRENGGDEDGLSDPFGGKV